MKHIVTKCFMSSCVIPFKANQNFTRKKLKSSYYCTIWNGHLEVSEVNHHLNRITHLNGILKYHPAMGVASPDGKPHSCRFMYTVYHELVGESSIHLPETPVTGVQEPLVYSHFPYSYSHSRVIRLYHLIQRWPFTNYKSVLTPCTELLPHLQPSIITYDW